MQLRYFNGGPPVLDDRLPLTVSRLQAMIGPNPVLYRVEDAHTGRLREATSQERVRIRAWLRRFIRHRGCTPIATHPVHRVGFVSFRLVWN
jgi:hypothetical protein